MKHSMKFAVLALSLILSLCGMPAWAYDLPTVNLGFTSFLDGGPPAGPGLYISQYLQYYGSDSLKNRSGDDALPPGAGEDLSVWAAVTQLIYQSDQELFMAGKWGVNLMVPIVSLDMSYDMNAPFPEDNGTGIGDILVGPYLQWDPVMGENGPRFMHRIELQVLCPTGKYDSAKELNPGSNYFSFNPYWAFTAFATPQLTFSGRLHWLYNFENDDPNRGYAGAEDTRAGQAFHANFAAAYEVLPRRLRVGINGYYLNQFTDTEVDGVAVNGTGEKVMAVGPGAVFHISPDMHLFLNLYFETEAENRPQGTKCNIRYVHHF